MNPRIPVICWLLIKGEEHSEYGVAFIDNSGGTIFANELSLHQTIELLAKLPIFECLYPESQEEAIQESFFPSLSQNARHYFKPFGRLDL